MSPPRLGEQPHWPGSCASPARQAQGGQYCCALRNILAPGSARMQELVGGLLDLPPAPPHWRLPDCLLHPRAAASCSLLLRLAPANCLPHYLSDDQSLPNAQPTSASSQRRPPHCQLPDCLPHPRAAASCSLLLRLAPANCLPHYLSDAQSHPNAQPAPARL